MKPIIIPDSYNYIAVFLTFKCNLECSFCINNFESIPRQLKKTHLSGDEWIIGLNRIVSRTDLRVTLQGGEPLTHKDFVKIVNGIKKDLTIDVLTNLYREKLFLFHINPNRLKRPAPYACIRVSYHPEQMELMPLLEKVVTMQKAGFSIGVWGVNHPLQKEKLEEARVACQQAGIDFRLKEFLGEHDGKVYGTYRYHGAMSKEIKKSCACKTTELIIGPDGNVYRCTSDVYEHRPSIGHILDPNFEIEDIFRLCDWYGHCNPCDVKLKTNRFQQFGHSSVEIRFNNKVS